MSNSDGKTEFIYDADGLRTETRIYDANNALVQTDKYIWKDGVIDSHTLIINGVAQTAKLLYGSDNQPIGYITNNGKSIMFVKNIQGDVIALVDESGKVIVEYRYDSWGNMTYKPLNGTTQMQADRLVKLCPITYRGYNYDFTTGLYYLQSRYYNPKWGRFLNCDDTNILLSTQGETHGANLFAYCDNNPITHIDPQGKYSTDFSSPPLSDIATVSAIIYLFYIPSIKIKADDNKKGKIEIDLTSHGSGILNAPFADAIFAIYSLLLDEGYKKSDVNHIFYVLASMATQIFYESFADIYNEKYNSNVGKRQFLFDEECVADEIKYHCLGYFWGTDKLSVLESSIIMWVGSGFSKKNAETRCGQIDIAEQDAGSRGGMDDRTVFGYFSGIRDCYKNTKADPYWHSVGKYGVRIYQNAREDWKTNPISY